ncbi:unnamed protein product [Urochloa humidicola]
MAGGSRRPRRCSWIRRRRRGSKLGGSSGGNDNIAMNPGSRSCEEWIWVRGHRIRRQGRMRVDSNGNLFVPDSEDEELGMETKASGADVADLRVALVAPDAIAVGADGVMGDGVDVASESIPTDSVNVAAEEGDADGVKVEEDVGTGEEMHPKVAARLKMLLNHIDPTFRDVFVEMLKIRSINIEIYSMHNNLFIFLEDMGLSFLDFIWY